MIENTIVAWHECVKTGDPVKLGRILHDDVVFHSPVVFTPQRGKAVTSKYLLAAFQVLNGFQGDGASVESSQPAPSDDGRNACQILLISMFFSALFRIMTNDD